MRAWFRIDLWKRVIAFLILGIIVGLVLRNTMGAEAGGEFATNWIKPWGDAFLRLIKMLIVPLIFTTLVAGVVAMGDPEKLGSLGIKALATYFGTTAVAVTLGLVMGTIVQPGSGLSAETFATADISEVQSKVDSAEAAGGLGERLLQIIPENPIAALASGDVLPIIFFAIFFGVGILMAGEIASPVGRWFDGAAEAMIKVTTIVMETAPFGVFALMSWVMATQGVGVLDNLGKLAIALYLACILHIAITYSGIIKGLLRLPMLPFLRGVTDAQAVAYSTASSSATLPVTITCAEENLGVDKAVASSVLPLGATINMDGTAIYIGLVSLFGAQALGMDLSIADYFTVALLATLLSIGAAGIPSAGLLLSVTALQEIDIPEAQALLIIGFILPFDRLLDMMRTLTNVTGDAAVATAVAKWEGELDEEVFRARDRV